LWILLGINLAFERIRQRSVGRKRGEVMTDTDFRLFGGTKGELPIEPEE
jgi:hypothetical protein